MSEKKGLFISLEGSEGVGKSTSLKFIKSFIESKGIEVVVTREPGGTPFAEEIRHILLEERDEKVEAETELLLMYAARIQNVNSVIKPALNAGKWVISDRFSDASFAYQGGGRKLGFERIAKLHDWALGEFKPDRTFLFDMPVELGIERTKKRGKADRFEVEKMNFFNDIRAAYLKKASQEPNRISVIDAAPLPEIVQASLEAELTTIFQSY